MRAPLVKITMPGSWDFHDQGPLASLVPVHSRGIDRDWMVKEAAAGVFKDLDLKPDKDHSYIHLIAMGDSDFYGPNRNGDIFYKTARWIDIPNPEPGGSERVFINCGNKERHWTFEKFANVYKHHRNKKPKKAEGEVVKSAHNDDMNRVELMIRVPNIKWGFELEKLASGQDVPFSMATKVPFDFCLPPGTMCETDRGLVPVELIRVGDRVKTHSGAWRKVVRLMSRPYHGDMAAISALGTPTPLTSTGNHPVQVCRSEKLRSCWGSTNGKKRRHSPDSSGVCTMCHTEVDLDLEWVDASAVRVDDYCTYPRPRPGSVVISWEEAYLLGYYAGNGSPIRRLSGRRKDKGPKKLMGAQFSVERDTPPTEVLRFAASAYVGRELNVNPDKRNKGGQIGLYSKEFGARAVRMIGEGSRGKTLSSEVFDLSEDSMLALLAGYLDSDGSVDGTNGGGRLTSTNETLAYQFQRIAWAIGVPASCHRENVASNWTDETDVWFVFIPASAMPRLAKFSAKARTAPKVKYSGSAIVLTDTQVLLPVTEVSTVVSESLEVHNLQVEHDESYVAAGVVVHNCSECGHRSPTKESYCDHLKHQMNVITKEGNVIAAVNDWMTNFDISRVVVNADRIAFGLLKAASGGLVLDGEEINGMSGAELADHFTLFPPSGGDPYSLDRDSTPKLILLEKLAQMEKEIEARGASDETVKAHAIAAPDKEANKLSEHELSLFKSLPRENIPDLLGGLADVKITLNMEDFLKLVMGGKYDRVSDHVPGAEEMLPGVFNRLLGDPGSFDDFELGSGALPRQVRELIERGIPSRSMASGPVSRRVSVIIMRGGGPKGLRSESPGLDKKAGYSPTAEKLAEAYGRYKVAALERAGAGENQTLTTLGVLAHYLTNS